MEEYTWIGTLKLGEYNYSHFREIDLWRRYITSLYFAIVTMATVGNSFIDSSIFHCLSTFLSE